EDGARQLRAPFVLTGLQQTYRWMRIEERVAVLAQQIEHHRFVLRSRHYFGGGQRIRLGAAGLIFVGDPPANQGLCPLAVSMGNGGIAPPHQERLTPVSLQSQPNQICGRLSQMPPAEVRRDRGDNLKEPKCPFAEEVLGRFWLYAVANHGSVAGRRWRHDQRRFPEQSPLQG